MKEKIESLVKLLEAEINGAETLDQVETLRVKYLGKSGELTQMMPLIKTLPNEEKPIFGKWINDAKVAMEALIANFKNILLTKELDKKLAEESIDVTLPGYQFK